MLKNESEIKEFLKRNPHPKLVQHENMRDGYGTCINPVRPLFGAELHFNAKTSNAIRGLMDKTND